jgi:uncharacterized protein (DUF885 family)
MNWIKFAALAACTLPGWAASASVADDAATALFERCYKEVSLFSPIGLSWNGDYSANDRLDDLSDATRDAVRAVEQRCLNEALQFNPAHLSQANRESLEVFVHATRTSLDGEAFKNFSYPSNPIIGWDTGVFQVLTSAHPVRNRADAEAYIKRVEQMPRYLAQVRERLQENEAAGVILPRPLFGAVFENFRGLTRGAPMPGNGVHPLAQDFMRKLAKLQLPAAEVAALRARLNRLLRNDLQAALKTHLAFLRDQQTRAPLEGGLARVPGGIDAYNFALRENTTTTLTAGQVHELGLKTVADLKTQMQAAFKEAGITGSFASAIQDLRSDPRHFYPNTDAGRREMLADAMRYTQQARAALPRLFGRLPKAPVVVQRMERFSEAGDAAARYQQPSTDGTQPGKFYLNLANTKRIPRYSMEVLAYHEALPGHHMQNAIAQETLALPTFRKRAWYVAYGEGWALYSEQIGKEVGFYKTPMSEVGRLADSMWRACRLVVDTGLHAKGWTRAQAVDYMMAHIPHPREEIAAEVDRYLVWPGQATGYMIGKLRIEALRSQAQAALGTRFDIRQFHDAVLATGPVPLDVLDAVITRWIGAQQTAASPDKPAS